MISRPIPDHWPKTPTTLDFMKGPEAEWYWHRFFSEMDRRGILLPCDVLILELLVAECLSRDRCKAEAEKAEPAAKQLDTEMIQERAIVLSDFMDQCMLPPDFADLAPPKTNTPD